MKTRIITALILLPLALAAIIFLPPVSFSVLLGAMIMVGAWEWSLLGGITDNKSRLIYVACVLMSLWLPILFSPMFLLFLAMLIWLWMLVAIINYQYNGSGAGFQFSAVRLLSGVVVLVATWVSISTLKSFPNFGPGWLILTLFIIFGADIGAYFAGNFLGKNTLCSRVSPKKTREGFVGGILFSVLIAAIGGLFLALTWQHYLYLLILSVFTALFSVVGDLGVSLLKRISGIKDSGKFFPGHGGMLDRMDSVAAATVFFVFFALFFGL
ncbi:MAG: phosphatidate cytidylyltransferase [Gammaproteobacteria bacterium]|nr:phosphatidate cytidylyltransferase [Gammaproteobacteria bacterium]